MFIYLSTCECRLILQVWTWHHNAKLVNCMEEGGVHAPPFLHLRFYIMQYTMMCASQKLVYMQLYAC